MVVLVIIAVFLFSGWLCQILARKKEKNTLIWLVMGLLFGPLAVVIILLKKGDASQSKTPIP